MLREIEEKFRPGEDESDMGILFETTGYPVESSDDISWRFWDDYCDFEEGLGTTNLVRADKNEELAVLGSSSKNVDEKKVNLD